jgi:hypothetical protein
MHDFNRRDFLRGSTIAAAASTFGLLVPGDATSAPTLPSSPQWDAGRVRHLLPTVSDNRVLVKASFRSPLMEAPMLRVGGTTVRGRMTDTRGEFWQFHAVRNRLLRRALSFAPSAMVAIGDQVYWDLLAPENGPKMGASPAGERIAGKFDRSALVLGSDNETVLRRAVEPQLIEVYGTDFRSTPVFFMQDDHDYFDNDEATDEVITFPPPYFSLQLARATQSLFYPEFLPDRARPLGLPWSSAGDRFGDVSETFGTVRYGRLAEILLYDIRRTQTLAGPSAVYLDLEVEKWLKARTAAREVTHVVHVPSNPPGWTAGKWGEWYPDVLGPDGKLTTAKSKPYWQPGWLKQHDRLMESISAARERVPLVMSGDLHALAIGRMMRSGKLDFSANPLNAVLTGPISTRPSGWPSARRGTGALPPAHLDMDEEVKPIEQHGFTIADFAPDKIVLRMFKWDVKTQSVEAIDNLDPFHTAVLTRGA